MQLYFEPRFEGFSRYFKSLDLHITEYTHYYLQETSFENPAYFGDIDRVMSNWPPVHDLDPGTQRKEPSCCSGQSIL